MSIMVLNGIAEGEGEGLVLLHPIGLDHTFWEPQLLSAAGRRILRLDLRGHGKSASSDSRAPIQTYADDVYSSMRHYGMEKAAVLGLSFGGMVAQTLALSQPQAVSKLILCACPGGIPVEAREAMRERGLAAERAGMSSVTPATLERWFTPGFLASPEVERVRQRLLLDDVKGWSDGWHAISSFNALPRLGEIRVPTMVLAGEVDKATSSEVSRTLAGSIAGANLRVLTGAPHMMQIETGPAFAEAVVEFLRSPDR